MRSKKLSEKNLVHVDTSFLLQSVGVTHSTTEQKIRYNTENVVALVTFQSKLSKFFRITTPRKIILFQI